MSAASTSDKTPSLFGLYFYAVLMAFFGALLGFFFMASFSAQAFASQAEYATFLQELEAPITASQPGDTYYIEGDVAQTRSWESKRDLLATAGAQTVRLTEGELNAWMRAKFRPGVVPKEEKEASVLLAPGVPNVALLETGALYFNLPITLTAYGSKNRFIIFAHCDLHVGELHYNTVAVQSAQLPLPNILGSRLLQVLAQSYQATEAYEILSQAFDRAESITVKENELLFKLR